MAQPPHQSNDGSHASRVAVIFNASSRLGRAMALELALQGFSLALCTKTPWDLEMTVEEAFNSVEVSPFKVSVYECAITERASVEVCAREIFEDFGRLDVICFIEKRQDDLSLIDEDEQDVCPILKADGTLLRQALSPVVSDISYILDCFYPLLIHPKPAAPPIRFFDPLPAGAKRVQVHEDDDSESLITEKPSTSLFLYISTPDSIACRAGRSAISSRVRAIEALMEGLNSEAIARNHPVRASTAVVGTLDGEVPFWRFDREHFLQQAVRSEELAKRHKEEASEKKLDEAKAATPPPQNKKEGRSPSFEIIHSIIPKRFLMSRRASRSRGLESDMSVVEYDVDDEQENDQTVSSGKETSTVQAYESRADENAGDDDEDHIPPPSPTRLSISAPQRLTSESLTHAEASAWIIWGLSRGRTRIVVGYDALFLMSAWVPNAFLNRLFSFAGARRNLLPIRTTDDFIPRTESAKRAQARYDEERQRRQRAREIVTLMIILFVVFSPGVAMVLLFLVSLWHRTITSEDGHAATERAVAIALYIISLRRRPVIRKVWDGFREVERFLFGTLAQNVNHLKLKMDEYWRLERDELQRKKKE